MKIVSIKTRWVLDSLSNPTIEVDVFLKNGAYGRASVPTGISVGSNEASELRDDYPIFSGRGVSKALNIVEHTIAPVLINQDAENQESIDAKIIALDESKNKNKLGANTCLAISIAIAKAAANAAHLPFYSYIGQLSGNDNFELPRPIFSILGGGLHAQKTSDIESVMVIPKKVRDINSAIRVGVEIYNSMRTILHDRDFALVRASDGSFAPVNIKSNRRSVSLLVEAIKSAGYSEEDIDIGIDLAASHLFDKGHYSLQCDHLQLGQKAYFDWLSDFVENTKIQYVEDPFYEEAWSSWSDFKHKFDKLQIVGDDLITTNDQRLRMAIDRQAINTAVIKPIQIGTLTETIQTYKYAKKAGLATLVATRAGETEDNYLSHLAVGLGCKQIKCGAPASGERVAKYNELLRISESLQTDQLA